jgi:hypothetical protein
MAYDHTYVCSFFQWWNNWNGVTLPPVPPQPPKKPNEDEGKAGDELPYTTEFERYYPYDPQDTASHHPTSFDTYTNICIVLIL